MNEEVIEQLKLSKQQQGYLEKVKVDQYGNILSGRHRKKADENWPSEVVEVKDDLDRELKIIHYNIQRRIPIEETQKRLLKIAEILEAKNVPIAEILPQICKLVPYSDRYVRMLLPQKYKMTQMIREPKEKPLVECDRCHMATREAVDYNGRMLCPSCLEKAKYKPERGVDYTTVKPKVTTTIQKPKDTWQHRKATMMPQISKMENAVLVKLEEKGLHPEVQREFCLQSTTPDYYFPNKNVAVYLDGEVHKGREDRDEALRELLTKRHGVGVVSISYEGTSQTAEDEIVRRILAETNK